MTGQLAPLVCCLSALLLVYTIRVLSLLVQLHSGTLSKASIILPNMRQLY